MKYREIEYYTGEFCERVGKFCEHKSPMGWCDCEESCGHKTVEESFDDMHKKIGRIPTLQEFIETTGYSKTSYYKELKKYRLGLEKAEELKKKQERYAMTKKNK